MLTKKKSHFTETPGTLLYILIRPEKWAGNGKYQDDSVISPPIQRPMSLFSVVQLSSQNPRVLIILHMCNVRHFKASAGYSSRFQSLVIGKAHPAGYES